MVFFWPEQPYGWVQARGWSAGGVHDSQTGFAQYERGEGRDCRMS